jgi:hypothetical protein
MKGLNHSYDPLELLQIMTFRVIALPIVHIFRRKVINLAFIKAANRIVKGRVLIFSMKLLSHSFDAGPLQTHSVLAL